MKVGNVTRFALACVLAASAAQPAPAQRVSDGFAVTEWEEWAFASKEFWIAADNQDRSSWAGGTGMVAIADPDEWDDRNDQGLSGLSGSPDDYGTLNSQLNTPAINVSSVAGTTGTLSFNSSWRPEYDSYANQSAQVTARFDGGAPVELFRWNSNVDDLDPGADDSLNGDGRRANLPGVGHGLNEEGFDLDTSLPKNPAVDELVEETVEVPAGTNEMVVSFNFFDGTNDWWWAIDNIKFADAGGSQIFFEDFESLAPVSSVAYGNANPGSGAGPVDELSNWESVFDFLPPASGGNPAGDGVLTGPELAQFNAAPAYTQNPPDGWSITPDYTGPEGSWANENPSEQAKYNGNQIGVSVSAPGINAEFPIVPEPASLALVAVSLAGFAVARRVR